MTVLYVPPRPQEEVTPAVRANLIPALQHGTQEVQSHSGPFSTLGFTPLHLPEASFPPLVNRFCSCQSSLSCSGYGCIYPIHDQHPVISKLKKSFHLSWQLGSTTLQPSKIRRSDESSIKVVELHPGLEIESHRSPLAQEHWCHWCWLWFG